VRRSLAIALAMFMILPMAVIAQTPEIDDDDEILVRINGSDRVEADESVGIAVVINGDLELEGEVSVIAVVIQGDMFVLSGAVIDGDLVIIDGDVTMRDGSTVNGDLYLSNDAEWTLEDGATFNGDVQRGDFSPDLGDDIAWQFAIGALATWFGATLIAILAAVVFSGIGGRQLWTSAAILSARPGATILAAIAFWLALLIPIVPAILSVVGIPLLPLLAMIGLIIWFLGYITFATRIGAMMTGLTMSDVSIRHPYLPSIAGVVLLQLLLLIAVGLALGAGLIAWFGDGRGGLAALTAIPALGIYFVLVVAGLVGSGAIILRSLDAWKAKE
jgi:hypothetical protein